MRTSIPKQSIFNPSKVLYTIIGIFFSVLVLTSCSDSDGMYGLEIEDTALIDQIEKCRLGSSVASASLPCGITSSSQRRFG